MKSKINLWCTAILCFLCSVQQAKSQLVNGNFEASGSFSCTTITGWTLSSPAPEFRPATSTTNWVNLAGCNSPGANGQWIEQTIHPMAGKVYRLVFKLGTWPNATYDAGVIINFNVTAQLGAREYHAVFDNPAPSPAQPHWEEISSCMFTGTGTPLLVRFKGQAYDLSTNTPATSPAVIAIDSIIYDSLIVPTISITPGEECGEYCLTGTTILPEVTVPNVDWYIDDVLQHTGATPFCRKFPKGSTEVRATISLRDDCGTKVFEDIITYVVNDEDCPCTYDGNVSIDITANPTISLDFNAGYTAVYTQWDVDGTPVSGSPTSMSMAGYAPGTYTVCANTMGGLDGEPTNLCCSRICTEVVIPEPSRGITPVKDSDNKGNERQGIRTGDNAPAGTPAKASVLSIVPNPTSSVFRVASDKGYEQYAQVDITDMSGKVLLSKTNIDSNTLLDTSSFREGTYLVKVNTESGLVTLKLVSLKN